ncbi:lipoprotein [Salinisphaera shabanensis E1L3A]|uniref:Lipoprotein n=1 Tax=Salinisphaera shabanensis E1L3A TaxID=1033802 RepID=U2E7M9_9GAMM|nr:ABC-type transport auxiliary lipoprotein family protein [Salinisphaera shabanensis]ERJ19741.1 lipoprotein [Salinisphaera shabanensis E1L3A]
MMTNLVRGAMAAVFVVATTACSSVAPLQQVLLSPPQASRAASQPSSWQVRRVHVPEYLDNYDIQLRTDEYVLTRMPNAKWAERLPAAMTRLLQQTIDEKLVSDRGRDYDVDVVVDSFEPQPSGQVVLAARWKVTQANTHTVVARDNTVIQQSLPAKPRDPAAIGQAMSDAVRELAFEIVAHTSH